MRERLARLGGVRSRRTRVGACVALLVSTVLGGCASTEGRAATHALIGPDLQFVIPGPQQLGRFVDVVQLITARYRDRIFVFEGRLSASPERLQLVGLDGFGRRVLSIVWNGEYVSFSAASWLPDALKPENILADIAIVYWPEEAVRRGLAESNAVLRADQRQRSISVRGKDIIHVDYGTPNGEVWVASARYHNIAFGYELDLRSVAVEQ
jgi:Protein of unknown function (DUF3261)